MFAASTFPTRRSVLTASAVAGVAGLALLAGGGGALPPAGAQHPAGPVPTAREHPARAPHAEQPPARVVVDPPKSEPLARGVVIVPFRTENLQIVPVFGPAAATVAPRIGHLHVTLDDATWHWAHTSNDPVIVADLPPGPHKLLIELADANHNVLAKEVVKFEVPRAPAGDKPKADADKEFLTKVVPAIAASVKIIEYAAKNASDEKVRDFAERVAKQHAGSVKTATGHAKRLNITVAPDPDKDSKEMIDKLAKLKGTEFDLAFLKWLSHGHENTTVFDDEVKNGADAELKTYAKDSITAGNEHLKEAREHLVRLKK